ncbi:hypothetical protein D3C83_07560 [compost metagenome]
MFNRSSTTPSLSSARCTSSPPHAPHCSAAGSALAPHFTQIRRIPSRRTSSCCGTCTSTTISGPLLRSRMMASSASAWATVRGKPSSTNPQRASGRSSRSRTMAIIVSSSTRSPRSMRALASSATGLPSRIASRRMSPVEIFGSARSPASRPACVPLPAPGAPIMITFRPISRFVSPASYPRRPRIRVFFMNPS